MLPGGLTRVALEEGFAGRELVARRRQQRYLGAVARSAASRVDDEKSDRVSSLLATIAAKTLCLAAWPIRSTG